MSGMKIIASDNFARETVSDYLVCSDVSEHYGHRFVEMLNRESGVHGRHYRLVPDDHVLYTWEP